MHKSFSLGGLCSGLLVSVSLLAVPMHAFAFTEGMNAYDGLGQYDDSASAPSPIYTKAGTNNGPNKLGFNLAYISSPLDSGAITGPLSIAIDGTNHRLFVPDTKNNRVLVYGLDVNNKTLLTGGDHIPDYVIGQSNFYSNDTGTTQSTFSNPSAVAYDSATNRLFVSDSTNHRVMVFNVSTITNGMDATYVLGQPDFTTSTSTTTAAKMAYPTGLALSGSSLYVSDTLNSRVVFFRSTSISTGHDADNVVGQPDFTTNFSTCGPEATYEPTGLAYEPSTKHLFVLDHSQNYHRILVFSGSQISTTSLPANSIIGSAPVDGFDCSSFTNATTQSTFSAPAGLAVDSTNHRLFVTDYGAARVLVFSTSAMGAAAGQDAANVLGQTLFTTGTAATTVAGMKSPSGVGYDPAADYLYVLDSGNQRVTVYNTASITNGEDAVDLFGQYNDQYYVDQTEPTPIYTKGSTTDNSIINGYNDGPNKLGFNLNNLSTGGTQFVGSLAVDTTNHRLFIPDAGNNRVLVYNLSSSNVLSDRIPDYVLGQKNFYSRSSTPVSSTGTTIPLAVAYDSINNRLFVSEATTRNRVVAFDFSGGITNGMAASIVLGRRNFTTTGAAAGTSSGTIMSSPSGLVYDNTNNQLFVADTGYNRVLVFTNASIATGHTADYVLGQPSFATSSAALSASKMSTPIGLALDTAGSRLFVAELNNYRVSVFDVSSISTGEAAVNVLGSADLTTSRSISVGSANATETDFPVGLAYDSSGSYLFVSEWYKNRVAIFDVESITNGEAAVHVIGQSSLTGNSYGTTAARFLTPEGMVYDSTSSYLYVLDTDNNRVMVFHIPPAPVITSPAASAALTTATPTISGTGEATDTVTVSRAGNTLCTATVATGGTWSCTSAHIPDGTHTLSAVQTDSNSTTGETSASVTISVSNAIDSSGDTTNTGGGGGGSRGGGAGRSTATTPSAPSPSSPEDTGSTNGTDSTDSSEPGTGLSGFRDVSPSSWYAQFITFLAERGIIGGYKTADGELTGLFGPSDSITYAQMAKMFLIASGKMDEVTVEGDWTQPYMAEARNQNLSVFTASLDANEIAPRAAVIQTAMEAFGYEIKESLSNPFRDFSRNHPHADAILTAAHMGLLTGDKDESGHMLFTIRADDPINRAEVSKILTILLGGEDMASPTVVEVAAESPQSTSGTHTVNAYSLKVRATASITSELITMLNEGDAVTVVGIDALNWAEIVLPDGTHGFVNALYLNAN